MNNYEISSEIYKHITISSLIITDKHGINNKEYEIKNGYYPNDNIVVVANKRVYIDCGSSFELCKGILKQIQDNQLKYSEKVIYEFGLGITNIGKLQIICHENNNINKTFLKWNDGVIPDSFYEFNKIFEQAKLLEFYQ